MRGIKRSGINGKRLPRERGASSYTNLNLKVIICGVDFSFCLS